MKTSFGTVGLNQQWLCSIDRSALATPRALTQALANLVSLREASNA